MDLVFRQLLVCLLLALASAAQLAGASEFDEFLKPLFAENCTKCHGEKKTKGKVNLEAIVTADQLLDDPAMIKELIDVIDANDMPPEDEPQLDEAARGRMITSLKAMLRESAASGGVDRLQIRRLNRFQYNNVVRDLFGLDRDVFGLSEKLMTRHSNYLQNNPDEMPDKVQVACHSLDPAGGLADVNPFPKDLRAAHGFDNQANQLTLSPLLLDAFLKLSVSILDSPDFNEAKVGIWAEFFKAPEQGTEMAPEVRLRLEKFLKQAFRGPLEDQTLDRYTAYTLSKIDNGLPFTDCMKKAASAAMSSPLFLYRYSSGSDFELASRLSFFLWASSPDEELLGLAKSGELSKPAVLARTVERMLADPKIERFLDTFPSQWMQLENVLAATPDPSKAKFFSLNNSKPASTQMVLEPLLLFDTVFIENRPVIELIAPEFSYQSEFLKTWYTSDLKPPQADTQNLAEKNRANDEHRRSLGETIKGKQVELASIDDPVRARLLAGKQQSGGSKKAVDLKPVAAWEFDGNLEDAIGALDLKAHGKIEYKDGMAVLNENAFLESSKLPIELKAKTLEVWCQIHDVNQIGGGLMGIQGPGDFFDTIVIGERQPKHWISGSNGFSRTQDFPDSTPEEKANQPLHLAMVYKDDGTTLLYRNGKPYGKPFRKGTSAATFPKDQSSVIFGLRHLPPGGNKHLPVSLGRARLYDRALTAEELEASSNGDHLYITDKELVGAHTPEHRSKRAALNKSINEAEIALKKIPKNRDLKKFQQELDNGYENQIRNQLRSQSFQRVAATDPRYGGVVTNAAMLSMTSGPKRTHPIARGAWVIEVIFNDPPPPPPNDIPPLNENSGPKNLTIREKFAEHRKNPDCAGCHSRLDPLGFALENFDITGRWRDKYENGREVDSSGTLMKKYDFDGIVRFKQTLIKEDKRFAKAFTGHLLRFALSRELGPADSLSIETIVNKSEQDRFKLRSLIKELILSEPFLQRNAIIPKSK
ncbi:MAG: hypothetical protein ACI9UA_002324 [Pseudoalteromonas tetraodonis]